MKSFTFDEFVHYGRHHGGNIVNGMPWSFTFYGHPVSHENDNRYVISGQANPHGLNFCRGDLLIVEVDGSLRVRDFATRIREQV